MTCRPAGICGLVPPARAARDRCLAKLRRYPTIAALINAEARAKAA